MPMMEELLTRLQESPPQTEADLMDVLAATGYDIVPSEEGPELPGDEGPEDVAADEEMAMDDEVAAEEDEGMAEEDEIMEAGPLGMPPLPGDDMGEDRVSEDKNPRMKMKMLVMKAAGNALKGKGKGRK